MKFSYLIKACAALLLLAMVACSDDTGVVSTAPARSGPDPFVITPIKTVAKVQASPTLSSSKSTAKMLGASDFVPGDATGCCGTGCTVSCEDPSSLNLGGRAVVDLGSGSAFHPGDAEGCCGTGCRRACD